MKEPPTNTGRKKPPKKGRTGNERHPLARTGSRADHPVHLRHRQEGQGLVEYGLIIASIAILLIIAMLFLAGKIDDLFSKTGTSVDTPGPLPVVEPGSAAPLRSRPELTSTSARPGYPLDRAGARTY